MKMAFSKLIQQAHKETSDSKDTVDLDLITEIKREMEINVKAQEVMSKFKQFMKNKFAKK
jgi:hypothetical protein